VTLGQLFETFQQSLAAFGVWMWNLPTSVAVFIVIGIVAVFWWLVSLAGNRG